LAEQGIRVIISGPRSVQGSCMHQIIRYSSVPAIPARDKGSMRG
jgi:hypothetical protein